MNKAQQAEGRYKEALNQLRQHPTLIWTRNNFFLLVQSGLLAVAMRSDSSVGVPTTLLVCGMGAFIATIWYWVIFAGQKLQRQWRNLVIKFEKELYGEQGGAFVQSALEIQEGSSFLVSITTALRILSAGFIFLWIVFIVKILIWGLPAK